MRSKTAPGKASELSEAHVSCLHLRYRKPGGLSVEGKTRLLQL